MRWIWGLLVACLLLAACTRTVVVYVPQPLLDEGTESTAEVALPDADIRTMLVQQSLAGYPGNCPCPYNIDSIGRQCGGRSAYRRPGGAEPFCYRADVPQSMVDAYRHQLEFAAR